MGGVHTGPSIGRRGLLGGLGAGLLFPATGLADAFLPPVNVDAAFLPQRCFQNFNISNTRKLRRSLAKVRAGTGNSRWLFMGESNTAGDGAGTGGSGLIACRTHSYSYQLAGLLNSYVIPCVENSFMGPNGPGEGSFQGDSRLVFGAGWVADSVNTLGGTPMINSTTTNPVTFAPSNNVDTFKIWYIRASNKGAVTIAIDGGSPATGGTTINANGNPTAALSATFTASSSGSHAISITPPGNAGFSLLGIEAWDSTRNSVLFCNGGASGNGVSSLAGTVAAYSSLNVAVALAPDVTVLLEGQNDTTGATSISAYKASMQSIITGMQATGDVLLGVMCYFSTGTASAAAQDAIRQAIYDLAATNNLPIFDPGLLFVDYATANTDGYMFSTVHQNAAGYSQWAKLLFHALVDGLAAE